MKPSSATGWKRGKHVPSHMERYNGNTFKKQAMSEYIPAPVPAGHSSCSSSHPSAARVNFFYVPLSISKCSPPYTCVTIETVM